MLMPVAALAGGPRKNAGFWGMFSATVIIVTAIAVQTTPTFDQPPPLLSEIIGTMNLVSVGIFAFLIVNSFVLQRDTLRDELEQEKLRSEELLLNVLPASIAQRLQAGESVIADRFNSATILFADMVGFTSLSEKINAEELVTLLNDLFTRFDNLADIYGVEKIRTIGDAYMVVSGAPTP
jgi:adenylate cyclase